MRQRLIKRYHFFFGLCLWVYACHALAHGGVPLRIAVASNFMPVAMQLREIFCEQRDAGCAESITFTFASSGKLYAQILHGAPYHVFLSADVLMPKRLIQEGYAEANSLVIYAEGKLIVASKKAINSQASEWPNRLAGARVAIANPRLAPYGRASIEALGNLDSNFREHATLVYGENIAQVFHLFNSGAVDYAFLSASQILIAPPTQDKTIFYWVLPDDIYQPIEQAFVLLKPQVKSVTMPDRKFVKAFVNFLSSDRAKQLIQQSGYH